MTRTQEARIEEVKRKKKKGSKKAFKGSTFKGRKKTKKVQKGNKKIQAAPTPTTTKTKAGNEPKVTPEVEQAKSKRDRNRNRTVVERVAAQTGRIKRSTAFYGLPSEMPEKTREISAGNGSDSEVHKIVQQIMDHMLEKVEKASQVLNEAEKMNLDLSSAKTEQKKRRSSTDSVSIQISNQSELVEEIVDLFKAPVATTSTSEVVGKEKKTEPIRIFENSRQIKADQNEDSDLEKKRRSSFAASFYSSPNALRPKSERSLRRSSNSRSINYGEEEVQEARLEVQEARPEVQETRPEVQEPRPEVHEAKPKSGRSPRKSSNRRSINYDEEEEQVKNVSKEGRLEVQEDRPEVHEARPEAHEDKAEVHEAKAEVKETNSKSPIRRVRKPAENSNVEAKKPVKKRRVTIAGPEVHEAKPEVKETKMLDDDLGKPENPKNHVKKLSKFRRSTIAGSTTIPNSNILEESKILEEADVKVPSKRRRSSISGSTEVPKIITPKEIVANELSKKEVKEPSVKTKGNLADIPKPKIPQVEHIELAKIETMRPSKRSKSISAEPIEISIPEKTAETDFTKDNLEKTAMMNKSSSEKSIKIQKVNILDEVIANTEVCKAKLKHPAKKRKSIGAVQTSKKIDLQKSNSSDSITSTDSNEIIQKTIKNEVKKPAKKRKLSSSFIEPREIPRLGAKTLDLEDVGTDGSSQSGDEQRPRRQLNNNLFFDSVALSSRVLFPVEVRNSKLSSSFIEPREIPRLGVKTPDL